MANEIPKQTPDGFAGVGGKYRREARDKPRVLVSQNTLLPGEERVAEGTPEKDFEKAKAALLDKKIAAIKAAAPVKQDASGGGK